MGQGSSSNAVHKDKPARELWLSTQTLMLLNWQGEVEYFVPQTITTISTTSLTTSASNFYVCFRNPLDPVVIYKLIWKGDKTIILLGEWTDNTTMTRGFGFWSCPRVMSLKEPPLSLSEIFSKTPYIGSNYNEEENDVLIMYTTEEWLREHYL
jgi:hypothetical protein